VYDNIGNESGTNSTAAVWKNIVTSLVSEYSVQIQNEEISTYKLEQLLDTFYFEIETNKHGVQTMLRTIIQTISRTRFINQFQYQRIASLLIEKDDYDDFDDFTTGSIIPSFVTTKNDEIDTSCQNHLSEPNYAVLEQADILSAFLVFQQSKESSKVSHSATFLLLVGPTGTGKTYICDTIAKEASIQSSYGT
jgi:ATP-dependent protease Clp ATPase subunit